jgi:hypothetical protein
VPVAGHVVSCPVGQRCTEMEHEKSAAVDERPDPTNPAGAGGECRCGASPHPTHRGLCARGHTLPRHGAALSTRHGLYALNTPELRVFEDAGRALAEQSILDAGGRNELIARELADHEYRGVLHVRILKLAHALNVHGEFDKRGRLRERWIDRLERLISSAVAIDKTLGLKRRSRDVTLSDYLKSRRENAE